MNITYPYEIESSTGGRWVFRSNDDGDWYIDGELLGRAVPSCEELVDAIEAKHWAWRERECIYHGPLREEART